MSNGNGNPFATGVGPTSQIPSTLEQKQQQLAQFANVCKIEMNNFDKTLAELFIKVGKVYSEIPVKFRNFNIFKDIPFFTHKYLDAAIKLSQIKDIEKLITLGWKKLYYFYINSTSINVKDFSIDTIEKEFGSLTSDSVEKGLMKQYFKKLSVSEISKYWDNGFRLCMCSDKANIKKMLQSKNLAQTISGIIHRYGEKSKKEEKDPLLKEIANIERSVKTKIKMIAMGCNDFFFCEDMMTKDYDTSKIIIEKLEEAFEIYKKVREQALDELLGTEKDEK